MVNLPIRHLLIVKPKLGLWILDRPSPTAFRRRAEPLGSLLYAYNIHYLQGVPYAHLQPREVGKEEWCRVAEAGSSNPEYCDVINLDTPEETGLAAAINRLAAAIDRAAEKIADVIERWLSK